MGASGRSSAGCASASRPQTQSTVEKTTYEADEQEIWVTCQVGTKISDYIDGLAGWLIESEEGLSQKLRGDVPRETARLIVRDAFGAQVARDLLGPGGPVGFVSPDDFFAPLDDPSRLVRQDLDLVGRASERDGIVAAASDPVVRVVVVPGRGGIGKTRLLRAVADQLSKSKRVLFASDPSLMTADVLEDLPLEDTVVFVDDAHRHEVHLAGLMAASLRRSDPLTLVLATRPAGLEAISLAAAQAHLEPQNVVVMPALDPLSSEEMRELAGLALGGADDRGDRLASATNGPPLMAILGGRMIARGDFDTDPVTGGRELRRAVMSRFIEEQRGRVTPRIPEDKAKSLLELLAALNPLNTADDALMGLVAGELGVAVSQVRRWLGDIQDTGVLQSRGDLRRLTPDILADELLYESCLDRQGRPTGRAIELWQRYAEHAQTVLLSNLGELDWRTTGDGVALLDEVWGELTAAFETASA